MANIRIGHGYDVHRLVPDRKLVLAGVEIPYELGLLGHSDADVAAHAAMDAILGALALGDIGRHFPDCDPSLAGADSMHLLQRCAEMASGCGYRLGNLDLTVIAQKPKLARHIPAMRRRLASALGAREEQVNVKATTEEGLGFTGAEEGIAAHCVCLLERSHD